MWGLLIASVFIQRASLIYTIAPVILWDSSRVWKILTAYVYTGAMVLGKTKTLISGKSIVRTVPKGQQFITEGTHEAIVGREEFEKAQLVIKSNSHKVLMGGVDFPLKGKVRCGNCRRVSCPCCNNKECVIIWATKRPERGHYESDSMAVKIGAGDDNPAADSCCVAGKMVCGISASLFGMVFLSAGQCAIGNGDAFVPDAAITGDGSTSNADRWIRDFYDTAGGRQRDRASGTGGSNASAGMVHIK